MRNLLIGSTILLSSCGTKAIDNTSNVLGNVSQPRVTTIVGYHQTQDYKHGTRAKNQFTLYTKCFLNSNHYVSSPIFSNKKIFNVDGYHDRRIKVETEFLTKRIRGQRVQYKNPAYNPQAPFLPMGSMCPVGAVVSDEIGK